MATSMERLELWLVSTRLLQDAKFVSKPNPAGAYTKWFTVPRAPPRIIVGGASYGTPFICIFGFHVGYFIDKLRKPLI